jgi:hypothetical protein
MAILALRRERSPQAGSLQPPERVPVADTADAGRGAGIDAEIGHVQIATACSVRQQWLVLADFARPRPSVHPSSDQDCARRKGELDEAQHGSEPPPLDSTDGTHQKEQNLLSSSDPPSRSPQVGTFPP